MRRWRAQEPGYRPPSPAEPRSPGRGRTTARGLCLIVVAGLVAYGNIGAALVRRSAAAPAATDVPAVLARPPSARAAGGHGFVHDANRLCKEPEDPLIALRAERARYNATERAEKAARGMACPARLRRDYLDGIPDDSLVFGVGDSLLRKPLNQLCTYCGQRSCNLEEKLGYQACELERGIKVMVACYWGDHKKNYRIDETTFRQMKGFLAALYPSLYPGSSARSAEPAAVPPWLQWLRTVNATTPFPTSCGGGGGAHSCPKLFVVTNMSLLHTLFAPKAGWGKCGLVHVVVRYPN